MRRRIPDFGLALVPSRSSRGPLEVTRPLPKGIHVWGTVREGVLRCRCGDELWTFVDMGGREGTLRKRGACKYRPSMRYSVKRDAEGLPAAMHWMGYW